ncbi:hypothetical protein CAEBREN_24592 [Caenorhabditis brenneri]|uniref:Uncharacterized protein n=1 Tax=Caenorhabditis brenneri TaxID=135651 RepID=G0N041_CAEBE|nr:hypothetical protein CAEBREN_24592 [Caenorhabditis brenneri]
MIVILGHLISRITPVLILLLCTTTIFIQCIVKKKQKKGGKLAPSPPDGKGPPALPSPGTTSKKPPTQQNTSYQIMKGRQKPMVVFEDEVTKSMPKTPKTKSVEETSMRVNRNASNSSKFDSSASVHEKELPQTSNKIVTPAKKNDSVEENIESVESDEQ